MAILGFKPIIPSSGDSPNSSPRSASLTGFFQPADAEQVERIKAELQVLATTPGAGRAHFAKMRELARIEGQQRSFSPSP